jgi:hypothetical protein
VNGFCLHACTVVTVIARDESQFTNEVSVLSFLHKKKAEKRLDRSEHPVIWRKSLVIVSHAVASLSIEEPTTRTQNGSCTFRPITNVAEEGKETGLAVAHASRARSGPSRLFLDRRWARGSGVGAWTWASPAPRDEAAARNETKRQTSERSRFACATCEGRKGSGRRKLQRSPPALLQRLGFRDKKASSGPERE